MKFQYLLFTFILALSFSAHSQEQKNNKIIINNVDIMTWPEELTALEVIDIYTTIMNSIPEEKDMLIQVNKKLQDNGISSVRDIFKYCEGESEASAFFSQQVDYAGARSSIPGLPENSWSSMVLEKQKSAYSSKVVKTLFYEHLLVSQKPEICVYKGKQLHESYDAFVHELTHFLLSNPYAYYEDLISSQPFPDFVQMTVLTKGGELDAFKIGNAAGLRFAKKYNIPVNLESTYMFFNTDGKLIDEEGLKNIVLESYGNYYKNISTVNDLKKAKLQFLDMKLTQLRYFVQPHLQKLGNADLLKNLSDEIVILENLKSQL